MKEVKTGIVNFHDIGLEKAAESILEMSSKDGFSVVVTPNIDHLSRLNGNAESELSFIYKNADLSLCDSKVLQKLLKLKGIKIENVVPGSTLTEYLFSSGVMDSKKICIVGADEDDIELVKERFKAVDIAHISPSMGFINKPDEVKSIVERITFLSPDIVFLAVGSPRQEILASKISESYSRGVGLCVGASILFLVGKEKRAPLIIQYLHLEWAYRAIQRPKTLLKRYAKNFLELRSIYSNL